MKRCGETVGENHVESASKSHRNPAENRLIGRELCELCKERHRMDLAVFRGSRAVIGVETVLRFYMAFYTDVPCKMLTVRLANGEWAYKLFRALGPHRDHKEHALSLLLLLLVRVCVSVSAAILNSKVNLMNERVTNRRRRKQLANSFSSSSSFRQYAHKLSRYRITCCR